VDDDDDRDGDSEDDDLHSFREIFGKGKKSYSHTEYRAL
jgi:hypothetical protein